MAVNPQVQAYVDATTAFYTAIGADIDDIVAKMAALNDTIAKLQGTPPVLSTEDQALLDSIQAQGKAVAAKADAADGKEPPAPPVAPAVVPPAVGV